MKKLCVSSLGNRIFDTNVSKKNPNLMVGNRVDRTEEVEFAFLTWLMNQIKKDDVGIELKYSFGTLTFVKENGK